MGHFFGTPCIFSRYLKTHSHQRGVYFSSYCCYHCMYLSSHNNTNQGCIFSRYLRIHYRQFPGVYIFQIPRDTFPPIPRGVYIPHTSGHIPTSYHAGVSIFLVFAATIACNVFTLQHQPSETDLAPHLGF